MLLPKDFTFATYKKLLEDAQFWKSFVINDIAGLIHDRVVKVEYLVKTCIQDISKV